MVLALFCVFVYFQGKEPAGWSTQSALDGVWSLAKVIVGLGLVIFIHELGHFLVAKWCDVHVQTFSIGFGPALPGCKFQWGETTYKLALIPLGGYVQMVGQVDADESADPETDDDPRSYRNKTVGQRMAIISAGVVMNVILAVICFVVVFRGPGKDRPAGVVGEVDMGSPAWRVGVRSGVIIDRIGNVEHPFFNDLQVQVMSSVHGQELKLVYHLPGKKEVAVTVEPRRDKDDNRPVIGVAPPRQTKLEAKRYFKNRDHPVLYRSAA